MSPLYTERALSSTAPLNSRSLRVRGAAWSCSVRKSSICSWSPKYTASRSLSAPFTREHGLAAQPGVVTAEGHRGRPERGVAPDVRPLEDDGPGSRPVLLHREVLHVRRVTDDELDDAVDEVLDVGRAEPVEDGDLALAPRPRRACAGTTRARRPSDQCSTTIGFSTTTPFGTRMNAPPARKASCRSVNASGDSSEHMPEPTPDVLALTRGETADDHALRRERVVHLVVHHPAVAHDDQPGAVSGFRREHTATGRVLDADDADLFLGERAVAVQVELVDPAVAPDLFGRGRPFDRRELLGRAPSAFHEPVGTAECERGSSSEPGVPGQPTAPSMLSSISRLSSTAYSIGSVFVIGSMNPFTIIATACCSERPRLIR